MSSKTDMEQTIQTLKGDNQELMKENASLKKQISGFKTSNANYKKQIAHLTQLDNEGDELNEKRIAEMDVMQKNHLAEVKQLGQSIKEKDEKIAEKDRVIAGLQSQIAELTKRIANNEKNIQDITGERDVAIANYDYVCGLPWYQRMFFKGK